MTRITATCHCGAIRLSADLTEPLSKAARCDCSFCRRRQAANVSARWDSITLLEGTPSCYSFGTLSAQHFFCPTCGIYTHHRRRIDADQAGINLYCIEGTLPADFEPLPWNNGINHPSDQ